MVFFVYKKYNIWYIILGDIMAEINYGRGYVYSIQYHIVWCVKYRHKLLIDEIDNSLKEMIHTIANDINIKVILLLLFLKIQKNK